MDKWIENFINEHNDRFLKPTPESFLLTHHLNFKALPKGFRRFVSDHLFYYESMTTKSFEYSNFDFILVHRSIPFKFDVDFYYGVVYIHVLLFDDQREIYSKLMIGKYLISDFLYGFISGQELYEIQSKDPDNQTFDSDDDFEIPF